MNTFSSSFILIITLLEVSVKTNLVLHDSNHGILSNTIESYSANSVPELHVDISSSAGINRPKRNNNGHIAHTLLKFEPEFLDFQERPLGIPYLRKVMLFNTDKNKSIDMKSISGNTVHFHSSFFEDKHIPPLGNTSFNVVFLGRDEGVMESDLLIHTTKGHFKYKVKGASVSSLYRLRPIVGIKLPQNTTFSPLIFLYNPHIEPIQVTEVYSTGDNFHLELPTGANEGPKNIWEIPPLQTKAIIRVKFHSHKEQNHTAYIRFKLNNTETILAVPLEVEVTASDTLYSPQGFLDFGVGGSLDDAKVLSLYVQNSSKKSIKINGIISFSKSIRIKYETLKFGTDLLNDEGIKIATVTLDWKSAYENKEFSGKILVKYNNGQSQLEIPYYASILEGNLVYDPSVMTYFINEYPNSMKSRELFVKNNYSLPLAITNISLPKEAEKYFYTSDFQMVILQPQEKASIFTLFLKSDVQIQGLKLNSVIKVTTNTTVFTIPLLSYNGKLRVEFPYKSKDGLMDLGLIGIDVKKEIYFVINNFNSAVININRITTSLPLAEIEIFHCNIGNYTEILTRNLSYTSKTCDKLGLDEFAILQLTLQTSYMEGQVWGTVLIETQYENLTVPVHYKVAQGRLKIGPEQLVFDNCFPGKICAHPLRIHSTFNDPMIIEKIVSIPPDPRLSSEHSGHIMARSAKTLGHLYFNPSTTCMDECYLGLNFIDSVGWLHTMMLPSITSELDLRLVTVLYNRYLNETQNGFKKFQNLTLKLDTSEVKWHIFETSVVMTWPSLVLNDTILNFPLTQTGKISYFNITLTNPSDRNLVMQLVLSPNYPDFVKLNDGLPSTFLPDYNNDAMPPSNAFFFNEKLYLYRVLFKTLTGLDANEATLPILLPPGKNFTFSIGFDAEDPGFNSGFLYIRNNLTVIEVIQLSGRGVIPNFKFGNRKLNSDIPLLFELNEKQLKDCEKKRHVVLNFSMKRSFTARNLGDIAITVAGFYINGLPCEGFGFKVLNCDSFVLLPNSSRKIDIGYMPDFSMTKIVRTLTIDTSLNQEVSYILVATIPAIYLIPCSAGINRPAWEPYLYYVCLSIMSILLIFVIAMIITDAEHSLKASLNAISHANATIHPPLDLRQVGAQTRFDIHSSQVVSDDSVSNAMNSFENNVDSKTVSINSANLETDKYSVLIPATGKSKKKMKEDGIEDNQEKHKKSWLEAHKLKNRSNIKDVKRNAHLNNKDNRKENKKSESKKYEAEEEETYSVSTDSSNNEDTEVLKIIGNKSRFFFKNRVKVSKKFYAEEQGDDTYAKDIKKTLRKPLHKIKEKEQLENNEEELKYKRNKNNVSKDYFVKRNVKRKLTAEKKSAEKTEPAEVSPAQVTMWGDTQASFSDVVAKTVASPINFICETEQSVPLETYASNTHLGPIGSRKVEHPKEQCTSEYCNSFHSNNNFVYDTSRNWNQLVQPTSISPIRDNSNLQSNVIVSGIWNSVTNNSLQNNMHTSYSSSNYENGNYLWGSSSVWKPWEPSEIHRSRTRTPPGFNNSSTTDVHENVPINQNYDLFGMSNIWAKQYPNPWNSNPGEQ